jgi:hypothetical protein
MTWQYGVGSGSGCSALGPDAHVGELVPETMRLAQAAVDLLDPPVEAASPSGCRAVRPS